VSGPGALVVHGLTGSPQSLGGLPAALARAGFETVAPLLPGHGTSPEDLAGCGWGDWEDTVEASYADLAARCRTVVACGLSMGGALAAGVAACHAGAVAGLAVVNPLVDPPAGSFRQLLGELLRSGHPFLPGIGGDVADGDAREDAYDRMPVAALLSMSEGLTELASRLGGIRCPVLILTSRHDGVVDTVSSDMLASAVAGPVERVWLERSRHVATLDLERDQVTRRIVEFATRVAR
jgi:carboxylesterase